MCNCLEAQRRKHITAPKESQYGGVNIARRQSYIKYPRVLVLCLLALNKAKFNQFLLGFSVNYNVVQAKNTVRAYLQLILIGTGSKIESQDIVQENNLWIFAS